MVVIYTIWCVSIICCSPLRTYSTVDGSELICDRNLHLDSKSSMKTENKNEHIYIIFECYSCCGLFANSPLCWPWTMSSSASRHCWSLGMAYIRKLSLCWVPVGSCLMLCACMVCMTTDWQRSLKTTYIILCSWFLIYLYTHTKIITFALTMPCVLLSCSLHVRFLRKG